MPGRTTTSLLVAAALPAGVPPEMPPCIVVPAEVPPPAARTDLCDDGSVIDVMVVYTPAARDAAGGPAAIEAQIALAIAGANDAYGNSGIEPRLNLVHVAEVDYDEVLGPDDDCVEHLHRLRRNGDGIMDEVHALRDEYLADLVQLILADDCAGGHAYLMGPQDHHTGFAPFAFSTANWQVAALMLTSAHELGHIQGCQHQRAYATLPPVFDYAYGYNFTGDGGTAFRTVMAYLPGTRIPHFSNPEISWDGRPTGVPQGQPEPADNARTINETALVVANFRNAGCACVWDCQAAPDGAVGIADFLQMLADWGTVTPCDFDGDGVGAADFLDLLGHWGPCP
jgi:hypothetical protein